jgi:hypothetical protein
VRQGKASAEGVEDPTIKIQLLLGGEKMMNKALREALELQTVVIAASPHPPNEHHGIPWELIAPQPG